MISSPGMGGNLTLFVIIADFTHICMAVNYGATDFIPGDHGGAGSCDMNLAAF